MLDIGFWSVADIGVMHYPMICGSSRLQS